jgi:hypothetical protein
MGHEFFHYSEFDGERVAIQDPTKEKIIEEFNKIDGKIRDSVFLGNFEPDYGEALLALGCVEDNDRVMILYSRMGKDLQKLILLDQDKIDSSEQITRGNHPDIAMKYPISETVEKNVGLDVLLYYAENKELPQNYLWKNETDSFLKG